MTIRLSSSPGYRPGEQEQIAEWIAEHGQPRRYGYGEQAEQPKRRRNRMSRERQVLAAMKSHAVRAAGRAS